MKSDGVAAVLAAIAELRGEVRQLRTELALQRVREKTPRQLRAERRVARYLDLMEGFDFGPTWAAAELIARVLAGELTPPDGTERAAQQLRNDPEAARSVRGIYRVLTLTAADTTDSR